MSLLATLLAAAHGAPDRPALAAGDRRLTRGEVAGAIGAAAHALAERGVGPGDRVLLSGANGTDFVIAYFAIHARRAIAVLAAPDTPAPDMAEIVARTAPRLALSHQPVAGLGHLPLASLAAGTASTHALLMPDPEEPADLLFTTGTTGARKGVLLAHRAIAAVGRNIAAAYDLTPDDIHAVPLPLAHSHGLGTVRAMAHAGNCLLIERGLVPPRPLLERLRAGGATALALVPAALEFLRRYAEPALLALAPHLRVIELGSAALAPASRQWLADHFPATRLLHHYGMTEASRAVFGDYHRDGPQSGITGLPATGVALAILNPDGMPVPADTVGEIAVAGDILMDGYWTADGLDRSRIGPHGFRTGDAGSVDRDGRLRLEGRMDDLINVGGKKVAPDDVEEVLRQHPSIADAGCVAAPDPVLGEVVAAFLVTAGDLDPEALATWLAPRLESHQVPRHFHTVAAIPRTASGKIQRARLRG